jgi:glycosyltransferase involved in cell wall biosynthesis
MKIAYVTLHWPRTRTSGVGRKIAGQIQTWHNLGHTVQLFMHTHAVADPSVLLPAETFFYQTPKGLIGKIITEFSRIQAIRQLIHEVKRFQPELIYFRWGMYVYPMHKLNRTAPLIIEINTNDIFEHQLLGLVLNIYNRLTRGITLQAADGYVSITHELTNSPQFNRYHKPIQVISNGIDISTFQTQLAPDNPIPHLLFIGSPGMPWHGIEKLVELATDFPDLEIEIVGSSSIPGITQYPNNFHLHGFLEGENYLAMLRHCDVAIGTCSLYKKGMQEAAPLKIRDCAAAGLPLILPYTDTDFNDLEHETILKLPNNEGNIKTHGQTIHDFTYTMRGKRIPRDLIIHRIDFHQKEIERLKFFTSILQRDKEKNHKPQ